MTLFQSINLLQPLSMSNIILLMLPQRCPVSTSNVFASRTSARGLTSALFDCWSVFTLETASTRHRAWAWKLRLQLGRLLHAEVAWLYICAPEISTFGSVTCTEARDRACSHSLWFFGRQTSSMVSAKCSVALQRSSSYTTQRISALMKFHLPDAKLQGKGKRFHCKLNALMVPPVCW